MTAPLPVVPAAEPRDLRTAVIVCLCLGCCFAVGCATAGRNYLNENDKLRSENLTLSRTVQKLQKILNLRLKQIETLEQRLGGATKVAGVGPSDIPRVVSLEFGRFSGATDTNGDGVNDRLRLYVKTLDQYGHFIPAMGPADLQVVAIRPGQKPVVLANEAMSPQQFGQAYRSGLTGTHYTFSIPLPTDRTDDSEQVTAKVVFTDAASGAVVGCQQAFPIGSKWPVAMPGP